MIIDTHCHFDMMPNPEAYISAKEKVGDIVTQVSDLDFKPFEHTL